MVIIYLFVFIKFLFRVGYGGCIVKRVSVIVLEEFLV